MASDSRRVLFQVAAMQPILDVEPLQQALNDWLGFDVRPAERGAFFRDVQALWDLAPAVPHQDCMQGAEAILLHQTTLQNFIKIKS